MDNLTKNIEYYLENNLRIVFFKKNDRYELNIFKAPWKTDSPMYVIEGDNICEILNFFAKPSDEGGCQFDVVGFLNSEEDGRANNGAHFGMLDGYSRDD